METRLEVIDYIPMNVLVRVEQSSDAAAIDHVLKSAFPTDQEARLVRRLRITNN